MSCVEKLKDIIKRISPRLKDCTMAIYKEVTDFLVLMLRSCAVWVVLSMEKFSLCLQFLRELVGSLAHINALVTHANSYTKHDPVSIIERCDS